MAAPSAPLYALQHEHSRAALAQLPEPKLVFEHLLMCLETPRPSTEPGQNHLKLMTDKLLAFGAAHGLDAAVDAAGNIRLRAAATKGFESATKICTQSHIDMVCSKANDKEHDFARDFVVPIIEGNILRADRTTLGADDGIGVAASLALLQERDSFDHGPLEAVFTVDEETTMRGAEDIAPAPFLQSSVMINCDSEQSGEVCIGCAGGFENLLYLPLQRTPIAADAKLVQGHLHSLKGGHTGIDIHEGRANAIIIVARLLNAALQAGVPLQLHSLTGGNAPNAIPRDATFVVALPTAEAEAQFRASLATSFARVQSEFAGIERRVAADSPAQEGPDARYESCMVLDITTPAAAEGALVASAVDTRRIVSLSLNVPHGPIKVNVALDHAVDTSISFSLAKLTPTAAGASEDGDCFIAHVFCRSSFDADMLDVNARLDALAFLAGAKCKGKTNYFPGWDPRPDSPALKQVVATYRSLNNGAEPRVYSVHAGLECGLFKRAYPDMDCVSIGPTIHHAHSPQECMLIDTVQPFYAWLKQSIINISRDSIKA